MIAGFDAFHERIPKNQVRRARHAPRGDLVGGFLELGALPVVEAGVAHAEGEMGAIVAVGVRTHRRFGEVKRLVHRLDLRVAFVAGERAEEELRLHVGRSRDRTRDGEQCADVRAAECAEGVSTVQIGDRDGHATVWLDFVALAVRKAENGYAVMNIFTNKIGGCLLETRQYFVEMRSNTFG